MAKVSWLALVFGIAASASFAAAAMAYRSHHDPEGVRVYVAKRTGEVCFAGSQSFAEVARSGAPMNAAAFDLCR